MNSVAADRATKWGLRGLTRSAAIELGRDGIRVNRVCPSSGNPEVHAPWQPQVDVKRYLRHVPPPALFEAGKPAPVDESRRITGTDLVLDAGWSAGKHCPGLPGF
jgi:3alpha(or 20beta)-hydroxysteroid dehydrogenase